MQEYFLGIDVSKGYADFVMLDAQKRIVERNFQLDDTFEGHCQLYHFLDEFYRRHPESIIHAAVESTGGYENNWFGALHRFQECFDLKVARLNPKGVKHNSEASFNRIVTDKVSARSIAEYLIGHPENVSYEADDYGSSLKRKWQFIRSLTKQKTRLLNQLEKLLYIANPQLLVYCKNNVSQWVLKLIELCPSARVLSAASVEQLAKIPYISTQRACELIEQAKKSVASATDFLTEDTIRVLASEILHLERLLNKQVALLEKETALPEIELLRTFGSIGTVSAIGLLTEMGPVERFATSKKLAAFWGLHPIFKTSADGSSGMRMSKQGRKEPRAILYMVTMNAIIHNPLIREIYHLNLKKGKSNMDAMGVCMHKIARIIYGMLKNKTPFDPQIDRKNRLRSQQTKSSPNQHRTRRYQKPDDEAPISRRQTQKRKEQELSHNDLVIKHEIEVPALSHN